MVAGLNLSVHLGVIREPASALIKYCSLSVIIGKRTVAIQSAWPSDRFSISFIQEFSLKNTCNQCLASAEQVVNGFDLSVCRGATVHCWKSAITLESAPQIRSNLSRTALLCFSASQLYNPTRWRISWLQSHWSLVTLPSIIAHVEGRRRWRRSLTKLLESALAKVIKKWFPSVLQLLTASQIICSREISAYKSYLRCYHHNWKK